MSLKEILFQDLKQAMKEKDTVRKDTIQIVRAGVLQIEKDNKVAVDDEGVMEVISREIKKRNDVLPDYEKSGRQDSIDQINRQIKLLKSYLPQQFSEDEVVQIVNDTISEVGAVSPKDMGKVMQAVAPKVKGRADNKLVSEIVKSSLNQL